jgi:hypothetical protein
MLADVHSRQLVEPPAAWHGLRSLSIVVSGAHFLYAWRVFVAACLLAMADPARVVAVLVRRYTYSV